jgi:pyruvate kinase
MLSGETASGQYPVETVETMARIILESEQSPELYSGPKDIPPSPGSIVESVEFSASRIAAHVGAACIAPLGHSPKCVRQPRWSRSSTTRPCSGNSTLSGACAGC